MAEMKERARLVQNDRDTWRDFTGSFRQMYAPVEKHRENAIPMYSYDRVSAMFWSAFMNGMMAAGATEQQATEYLCSKSTRWALDNDLGDAVEKLAFESGRAALKEAQS